MKKLFAIFAVASLALVGCVPSSTPKANDAMMDEKKDDAMTDDSAKMQADELDGAGMDLDTAETTNLDTEVNAMEKDL